MSESLNQNQEEMKPLTSEPYGKFKIAKDVLNDIAYACQDRDFSQEVDKLQEYGGDKWLEDGLCTDFNKGITGDPEDLKERDIAFGNNRKPERKPKSYLELVIGTLEDLTLRILIVSALISIIIETATADDDHRSIAWIEGFAILVAVMIVSNVTAANDYQKERQFQKLNKVADDRKRITVWRGGNKMDIHQSEVLVGDVIQVFEGMEIPADCYVIEAAELTSDESAMTGETDPIKKKLLVDCVSKRDQILAEGNKNTAGRHDVPSPIMMSGTRVLSGEGKMVALVVGDSSCVGKISVLLRQDDNEVTPLQMKLEAIAEDIGKFGLYSAVLIVIVLIIRLTIERAIEEKWENKHYGEFFGYFVIGITVVVVAIPEGLPLAVTISLAYSTKKMLKDNNLVRKMAACETMGGASMICSDKTGTLTQNKMSLVNVWNDELINIDCYTNNQQLTSYFKEEFQPYFIQAAVVNGTAMLRPEPKGSKTEIALLEFIEKCSFDYEQLREQYPAVLKFPFSSARKRMSMVLNIDGKQRLVSKGASEMVLAACKYYHSKENGQIKEITPEFRATLEQAIEDMADNALRTICLAYRDLSGNEDLETKDQKGVFDVETHDLTVVALLGIKDVLRQSVKEAVILCRHAGIKVRMVTGDNKSTARAIAKECGIIEQGDANSLVMEGPDFINIIGGVVCKVHRTLLCDCPRDNQTAKQQKREVRVDTIANAKEFDKIYPHLDVLARSRPEDKYALVTGLIERGHVVAVTGDGTNDAPALKKADVGFAMGIAGTEVAREAAAIILLDDNFNSIVKAVMWGRNIYDCIKKFLQFQLTVNVVAVGLTLISAAIIKQEVMKPIQLLWLNLIMDTFASLALATELPTEKLLYRKPHNRNEYIITRKMFKHVTAQAVLQLTIILLILFAGEGMLPEYKDNYDTDVFKDDLQYKYYDTFYNPSTQKHECPNYEDYCTTIASGRFFKVNGDPDYEPFYMKSFVYSRHFTYIFVIFVMLQVFNFINSRRIGDEFNVFENICTNPLFGMMLAIIFSAQILMTTFGGLAFGLYSNFGLNVVQWCISIAISLSTLPWAFFTKFLKEDMCFEFGHDSVNPLESNSKAIALKGSHSHSSMQRRYSSIQNRSGYNQVRQNE